MVYTTPDGISVLDLATHADASRWWRAGCASSSPATRRSSVYYMQGRRGLRHRRGHARRRARSRNCRRAGRIATVNADETLLAGTYIEGDGQDYNSSAPDRSHGSQQQVHRSISRATKGR